MKILVPLKRVPDPDTRLRLRADGLGLDLDGVKFVVNPFDAIALEEALRLKEKNPTIEIVIITLGSDDAIEQLRTGLAMGADRAALVRTTEPLDSLVVAKLLAAFVRRESSDIILMGKQAIDDDSNQAGQMLAALLGVAQATFISRLDLDPATRRARCARETDAGIVTIEVGLPAIFTTDLRLNEPRYVSLPGIMKAKKKPIETLTPSDLGVIVTARTILLKLELPPPRKPGIRVKSVDELLAKLCLEARVF